MVVRIGTTAMHCLASGLAGLGWQSALTERRWGRGLAFGLLGVGMHGAWNAFTISMALPGVLGVAGGSANLNGNAAVLLIIALCLGLLVIMGIGAIIAIPLIARRLGREDVRGAPERGSLGSGAI